MWLENLQKCKGPCTGSQRDLYNRVPSSIALMENRTHVVIVLAYVARLFSLSSLLHALTGFYRDAANMLSCLLLTRYPPITT